jgi:hypothetical protein
MVTYPEPKDLPPIHGLPDPLTYLGGARVESAADWTDRRKPELRQLFQYYMYGTQPPRETAAVPTLLLENRKALGGKATLREVAVHVGAPADGPVHVLLALPNTATGPVPTFIGLAFAGNHAAVDDPGVRDPTAGEPVPEGRPAPPARGGHSDVWNIERAIDRGYGVALFRTADVAPDRPDWPTAAGPGPSGTIALWAWGASRVLDYLETVPEIDAKRVAVVGHSRNGKSALVAAAFDDRFALAIPHQSGCGGAAPSRTTVGEKLVNINGAFPHWFEARFREFNDHPERLPFDQHCLIALCAPRPVLVSNAVEDRWCNPSGQFKMLRAAESVYRLLGAPGLDTDYLTGRLGFYLRPGRHSMTPDDWQVFLDYADRHL